MVRHSRLRNWGQGLPSHNSAAFIHYLRRTLCTAMLLPRSMPRLIVMFHFQWCTEVLKETSQLVDWVIYKFHLHFFDTVLQAKLKKLLRMLIQCSPTAPSTALIKLALTASHNGCSWPPPAPTSPP